MGLTVRDLAKICNVNVSTVSRALRDDPRITPATRDKIREAAREHGYSPNQSARNLAAGKTNSIWFFLGSLQNEIEQKPAVYMSQMLCDAGYDLQLVLHNNQKDVFKRLLGKLSQRVADAAIIIPPTINAEDLSEIMPDGKLPIIFLDRWIEHTGKPVVTTDNAASSRQLAAMCHQAGAEFFAVLFEGSNPVSRLRREAACAYLEEHGLPYCLMPEFTAAEIGRRWDRPIAILHNSGQATADHLHRIFGEECSGKTLFGGFFDNWGMPGRDCFSRVFICRQDFYRIAERCSEITVEWLRKGKAPKTKFFPVPPEKIYEVGV